MASLLELNTLVNSYCPNVPAIVVSGALRECARDYFKQVNAWTVDIPVTTVTNEPTIAINVGQGIEIVAITEVKEDHFNTLMPVLALPSHETHDKPRYFTADNKRTLLLFPTPDNAYLLMVTVAIRPDRSATEIDDTILDENLEALRFGTLSRLKSQPGTDWFSPNEVAYYDSRYRQEIADRRIQVARSEVQASMQVQIPHFI